MSKNLYKDLVNAYKDLDKEFECKKENLKLQQRISELEEQLKNTPKYTVYSKVFFIDDYEKIIKEDFVEQITINHRDGIYYELVNNLLFEECELFATKEDAQIKLRGE